MYQRFYNQETSKWYNNVAIAKGVKGCNLGFMGREKS